MIQSLQRIVEVGIRNLKQTINSSMSHIKPINILVKFQIYNLKHAYLENRLANRNLF